MHVVFWKSQPDVYSPADDRTHFVTQSSQWRELIEGGYKWKGEKKRKIVVMDESEGAWQVR